MITADRVNGNYEKAQFSFKGKSTDTKPVDLWKETVIANGSSFLEIDTKALSFYDEDTKSWV